MLSSDLELLRLYLFNAKGMWVLDLRFSVFHPERFYLVLAFSDVSSL